MVAYLALISNIVVEMINDCCLGVIKFDTALTGQLSDGLSNVGTTSYEHITSSVDEAGDGRHINGSTKLLHRWGEENKLVVQELAILDEGEGGVIR